MNRQEWIDEIADICDLVRFCWDNGYDSEVENVFGPDSRDEWIDNEIRDWDCTWMDLRDYLSGLEDSNQYDYWLRDDYDGTWTGIGDYEFNELKEQVLDALDNDNWFDSEEEEEEETPAEPEASDEFEELEPGDFDTVMNGFENVPQFDAVIALNLARMRAEQDERVRVEDEFQRIVNESNNLTAGDLSAVFH